MLGGGHYVARPPVPPGMAPPGPGDTGGGGQAVGGLPPGPGAAGTGEQQDPFAALFGGDTAAPKGFYRGTRSGKIVPLPQSFGPKQLTRLITENRPARSRRLMFIGELLHLLRPTLYSLSRLTSGSDRWLPLLMALGLDIASSQVTQAAISPDAPGNAYLNANRQACAPEEAGELARRKMNLLYYLLWNPLFNGYTRVFMEKVVYVFSYIPVLGWIVRYMFEICLYYQRYYFYTSAS